MAFQEIPERLRYEAIPVHVRLCVLRCAPVFCRVCSRPAGRKGREVAFIEDNGPRGRGFLTKTLLYRIAIYIFGLFVLTFATTLSINARLGLSAGNSFPYVLSEVFGISFGTALIGVYLCFVALQWLLLGKAFHKKNLFQIPVSLMYGRFADFWVWVLGDIRPTTYPGQVCILMISIVVLGLGVAIYVSPGIMHNPLEGIAYAVSYRIKKPFYIGKTICDCVCVALGISLALIFLGSLTGIREGTVLSALLTGKAVHIFSRRVDPLVRKICTSHE